MRTYLGGMLPTNPRHKNVFVLELQFWTNVKLVHELEFETAEEVAEAQKWLDRVCNSTKGFQRKDLIAVFSNDWFHNRIGHTWPAGFHTPSMNDLRTKRWVWYDHEGIANEVLFDAD